ncbi:Uncharacterised protein [BD1-7 clade bacterium]|uniref:HEAT repeat domain-containing protein n=1 Tax=BD1-7 clade bacterium TaxID=2029982 RepID=A0A5S9PWR8_9GAMM|nr:Uncharacterised protein [BD1-7 clade bacterium]CAA0109541.1 Uncharacterised protein [BD1-7 clade bacterium]
MARSRQAFLRQLYAEHLEEASFLYLQRLNLLTDNELSWVEIQDFETRLYAHLDALVIGGQPVLDRFADYPAADAGEVFAVCAVYGLSDDLSGFMFVLAALDLSDNDTCRAMTDALNMHAPAAWVKDLARLPFADKPAYLKVLMPFFYRQRLSMGKPALSMANNLLKEAPMMVPVFGHADLTNQPAILESVLEYVDSNDVLLRNQAAIVMLKQHQHGPLKQRLGAMPAETVTWQAMAVAMDVGLYQFLEQKSPDQLSDDAIRAFGLIGLPEAIPRLVRLLSNDEKAAAAADALFSITGAPLYEDVFIADEVTEEELFPEEVDAFKRGESPMHVDQRPFGTNTRRISQDADLWLQWLTQFKQHFVLGKRHRMGALISPSQLVAVLQHEQSPHEIRRFTAWELECRYQSDVLFSVADTVHIQQQQIRKLDQWANLYEHEAGLDAGCWHIHQEAVA